MLSLSLTGGSAVFGVVVDGVTRYSAKTLLYAWGMHNYSRESYCRAFGHYGPRNSNSLRESNVIHDCQASPRLAFRQRGNWRMADSLLRAHLSHASFVNWILTGIRAKCDECRDRVASRLKDTCRNCIKQLGLFTHPPWGKTIFPVLSEDICRPYEWFRSMKRFLALDTGVSNVNEHSSRSRLAPNVIPRRTLPFVERFMAGIRGIEYFSIKMTPCAH